MDRSLFVVVLAMLAVVFSLLGVLSVLELHSFPIQGGMVYQSALFYREESSLPVTANFIQTDSNLIGVSADTDELHFGSLPPGAGSRKSIVIENELPTPVKMRIVVDQELLDIVRPSPDSFILRGYEKQTVTVAASSSAEGNYSGHLTIKRWRPVSGLFSWTVEFL